MKNGHVEKLLDEVKVVLTEGDVEVCVAYVSDEKEAKKILEGWKAGTYKLLTET